MIINKCNIHSCYSNTWADGTLKKNTNAKGYLDNKWKHCKSRFPRKIKKETTIDKETGHINLIKKEAWINMFTPIISYIFHCNMDVTSLRSGTAIKAVLVYVTDYITKPGLKTHTIFDCIYVVFQRDKDQPSNLMKSHKDHARKLMTQMVNVLGVKTEIGSPMICSYLLSFLTITLTRSSSPSIGNLLWLRLGLPLTQ